jgi:hypothetical protein
MSQSRSCLFAVLVGLCLASCSSVGDKAPAGDTITLTERTRIPEQDPMFVFVEVSEGSLVFTYSSNPQTMLGVGDIIVGSTQGGYLRRAESVTSRAGGVVEVGTTQAVLTDAVESGTLRLNLVSETDWTRVPGIGTSSTPLTASWDFSGEVLFDGQTADGAQLTATIPKGNVDFSPDVEFEVGIEAGEVRSFKTIATGELAIDVDVVVTSDNAYEYATELAVAKYAHPFFTAIGPLPVAGFVEVTFNVGLSAAANACGEVSAGFDATTTARSGLEFKEGAWSTVWDPGLSANRHGPTWGVNGNANARVWVRPEIQLVLYGAGGPTFDVEPYAQLDATIAPPPPSWELTAGVVGHVGVEVGARVVSWDVGFQYEAELFDWHTTLATGACDQACPSAGTTECSGGQTRTCTTGADGCLAWGSYVACSTGACADPISCGSCTNTCGSGDATECAGGVIRTCVADGSGCLAWSNYSSCADGSCADATSCGSCTDTCPTQGAIECSSGAMWACDVDAHGCLSWGNPTTCSSAACEGPTACLPSGNVSNTSTASREPSIAVDGGGGIVVAWSEGTPGSTQVYLRRWSGIAWDEIGGSATGGGVSQDPVSATAPAVAIGTGGAPFVAFVVAEITNTMQLRYWNASSWAALGATVLPGDNNSGSGAGVPSAALTSLGMPAVAWSESTGTLNKGQIVVSRWDGSAWSPGSAYVSDTTTVCCGGGVDARLVVDQQDRLLVAWSVSNTSGSYIGEHIYLRRFSGSVWESVGNSATGTGISAAVEDQNHQAALVVDATDNPIVAWAGRTGVPSPHRVFLRAWDGMAWAELAGSGSAGIGGGSTEAAWPALALMSGSPVVAWQDDSTGNYEIYVKWFDGTAWVELGSGSAAGGGISNSAAPSQYPKMATLAGDKILLVWQEGAAGTEEIFASCWDGTNWK